MSWDTGNAKLESMTKPPEQLQIALMSQIKAYIKLPSLFLSAVIVIARVVSYNITIAFSD